MMSSRQCTRPSQLPTLSFSLIKVPSFEVEFIDAKKNVPDWKAVKEYLARSGKLSKKQVHKIVTEATKVFSKKTCEIILFKAKEPNMVKVPEPAVVVGDVHGQYYDLLTLLEVNK